MRSIGSRCTTCGVQAPSMGWYAEYRQERAGSVEIVRSDGRSVVVHFPRLPHSQKRYLSYRSRERFVRAVDRTSSISKREGLLAATLHMEVGGSAFVSLPWARTASCPPFISCTRSTLHCVVRWQCEQRHTYNVDKGRGGSGLVDNWVENVIQLPLIVVAAVLAMLLGFPQAQMLAKNLEGAIWRRQRIPLWAAFQRVTSWLLRPLCWLVRLSPLGFLWKWCFRRSLRALMSIMVGLESTDKVPLHSQ